MSGEQINPNDSQSKGAHRWLDAPETNIAIFSFLLNLAWEFWQSPFFEGLAQAQHWQAVIMCTRAALGDICISLIAFWSVSLAARGRRWVIDPTRWQMVTFVVVGLVVTATLEVLATGVLHRWSYASEMPVLRGIGIGLLPVMQWLLLPTLVLWFVRRQLG
jgi:hypothetical protein